MKNISTLDKNKKKMYETTVNEINDTAINTLRRETVVTIHSHFIEGDLIKIVSIKSNIIFTVLVLMEESMCVSLL